MASQHYSLSLYRAKSMALQFFLLVHDHSRLRREQSREKVTSTSVHIS